MFAAHIILNSKRSLLFVGAFILFYACKPEQKQEAAVNFEGFVVPGGFPQPAYSFKENEVTEAGFQLGRKLFYEARLSVDGSMSCASCHHQEAGFADPGKAFSIGVEGKPGLRNAPALVNLAWMPLFMADGGINHIEIMPFAPITDSLEMNADMFTVMAKIQQDEQYPNLFKKAFGSDSITSGNLFKALTQFMCMMISNNSRYDKFLAGEESLSAEEQRGYTLFQLSCANCHSGPLLTDFSYRNIGLDVVSADLGRGRITQQEKDNGKFKVPTLRNVELTYPYMHDGRFTTLKEAVAHFNTGIKPAQNLDESLQQPLNLSEEDVDDIIAFLKTLTDYEYISNAGLSAPVE